MRTPDSIKEEKIAQLYNCLDELKFYEMNSKLEDYEYEYGFRSSKWCRSDDGID